MAIKSIFRVSILFLIVCFLHSAEAQEQKPIDTTICQIWEHPDTYDNKIVRIVGKVNQGFEWFLIESTDPKCDRSFWLTYAGNGPTAMTSFGGATPSPVGRLPVQLIKNNEFTNYEKLLDAKMYSKKQCEDCMDCHRYSVTVTAIGRLDHAQDGMGFGHMNGAAFQFVLESIEKTEAVDIAFKYPNMSKVPVHFPTAYIRGNVTDEKGNPIENAWVSAKSLSVAERCDKEVEELTDEKGKYVLKVVPDEYIVGLNVDEPASEAFPYNGKFLVNTSNESLAEKVVLPIDGASKKIDFRMSNPLQKKIIPVEVVWPDGNPVADANVDLKDLKYPTAVVGGSVSHTSKDGKVDLIGYEGRDYFLEADIYFQRGSYLQCAQVIVIRAKTHVANPIRMVLDLKEETCKIDFYTADPAKFPEYGIPKSVDNK